MKNILLMLCVVACMLSACGTTSDDKASRINIYPKNLVMKQNQSKQFNAYQGSGQQAKDVTKDMVWSVHPSTVYTVSNESTSAGLVTAFGVGKGYVGIRPKELKPYALFQEFDNQYNLGYGFSQTTLKNGLGQLAGVSQQFINMEIERLFDIGLWLDVNAKIVTSSLNNQVNGIGSGQSTFNQQPNLGGMNIKIGYAFNLVNDRLLLTPYIAGGRNSNMAASVSVYNNNANVATNNFYYTGGGGARLEYRVNSLIDVYADQLIVYNADQSAPVSGVEPQNNMLLTSTLGVKFNVYREFQIGINGFYNLSQQMSSLPIDTTGTTIYTPCNCGSYGGMITMGLTY